jgi:hypothetical protein
MDDLEKRLEEARVHAAPRWTRAREDAALSAIERRASKRVASRWALAFSAAALACVIAFVAWRIPRLESAPVAVAPPASATTVRTSRAPDGSTTTPLGPTTRLSSRTSEGRVDVTLDEGGARFEVTPDSTRVFRVVAGDVTVTVLGTIFTVERRATDVRVAVDRGRVRVSWTGGEATLEAGGSGTYPPPSAPSVTSASPPPTPKASASTADHDEIAELLRVADAARVAGKPAEAEAALRRVTTRYAGDPRAPLASFALGRLYLDQLGRPRDAAGAFATARRAGGSLAEDSLAREVESWSRAGDPDTARTRAVEYVRLYPASARLAAVKKLGGIVD